MPTIGEVENQIRRLEGFKVHFVHADGTNMRSDHAPPGLKTYPYRNAADKTWTVAEWEQKRFALHYPGFRVVYLTSDNLPMTYRQRSLASFREL